MRAMCEAMLMYWTDVMDLMQDLDLDEVMDQLLDAYRVYLYGRVLSRYDGNVLRRALDSDVKGQCV